MELDNFGHALRDARTELGWTQDDLARKADVTERTISAIENGRDAQPRTRRRLAKALGSSVETLLKKYSEKIQPAAEVAQ